MASRNEFDVVWPSGKRRVSTIDEAAPLAGFDNKRIAFLWNFNFKGDEIFAAVAERLSAQYENVEFVPPERFGNIHSVDEHAVLAAVPDKLREWGVDAAVLGVGA